MPLSDPTFDTNHFQKINKDVEEYLNDQSKANDILDSPFDVAKLSSACKTIHNGKSAGYDGLMNEHLNMVVHLFIHICPVYTVLCSTLAMYHLI